MTMEWHFIHTFKHLNTFWKEINSSQIQSVKKTRNQNRLGKNSLKSQNGQKLKASSSKAQITEYYLWNFKRKIQEEQRCLQTLQEKS